MSRNNILLVLILSFYYIGGIVSWSDTVSVIIVNKLPDNTNLLKFHCYSKDDDMGNHQTFVNQEYFADFKLGIGLETIFYCDFLWGTKETSMAVFNRRISKKHCGYSSPNDQNICWWEVREDGFYVSKEFAPTPDKLVFMNRWVNSTA